MGGISPYFDSCTVFFQKKIKNKKTKEIQQKCLRKHPHKEIQQKIRNILKTLLSLQPHGNQTKTTTRRKRRANTSGAGGHRQRGVRQST